MPLSIYGDGVAVSQVGRAGSKSIEVVTWSSLLNRGASKTSYFVMYFVFSHLAKKAGFGQTWSTVWRLLSWSLRALWTGLWPTRDCYGNEWPENSQNALRAGLPLAGGYFAVVSVVQGDLEWMASHHRLNHHGLEPRVADRAKNPTEKQTKRHTQTHNKQTNFHTSE